MALIAETATPYSAPCTRTGTGNHQQDLTCSLKNSAGKDHNCPSRFAGDDATVAGCAGVSAHSRMVCIPSVANLIREAKIVQIQTVMQTGQQHGMVTMDKYTNCSNRII